MAKYRLHLPSELGKFELYVRELVARGAVVEICEARPKRTLQQNALLHKWIGIIADELGYTSIDECKRDCKRTILGQQPYYNQVAKRQEWRDYRTSQMTTDELVAFMNKLQVWALQEFGIVLPSPSDDK